MQPEFNSVMRVKKVSAEVKQSVEVSSPLSFEAKKPISVYAEAYIVSKEKGENETAVSAKVAFRFVYLTEDGYKKSEALAEVSAKIPLGNASVSARAEDARAVASADGYTFKANVVFKGEAEKTDNKTALSGGEGFFVKEFSKEVDSYTGVSEGTLDIEDEFELGYAVSEVLTHSETAVLNELTCGISAVAFDGEAYISLGFLPLSDGGGIIKEKRTIPFRYELENVGALPDMRALGTVEIKRVAVKVSADEAKAKSGVSIKITLGFSGEAVESVSVPLVSDAYSKTEFLKLKREKADIPKFLGQYVFSEKVIAVSDGTVADGGKMIAAIGERLSLISAAAEGGKIKIVGTVAADVVFQNSDNGITSTASEAPFDIETEAAGEISIVSVKLTDFSARIRNGGIEFEFTVKAAYRAFEVEELPIITEITEGEPREISSATLTVYIPGEGEDAWEIAKNLGESEEDIKRLNPELTFPLGAKDRIIIYRQKT